MILNLQLVASGVKAYFSKKKKKKKNTNTMMCVTLLRINSTRIPKTISLSKQSSISVCLSRGLLLQKIAAASKPCNCCVCMHNQVVITNLLVACDNHQFFFFFFLYSESIAHLIHCDLSLFFFVRQSLKKTHIS